MATNIYIKQMGQEDFAQGLALVWRVFLAYEAPDYTKEGVAEFYKSIHDQGYLSNLSMYGAYDKDELVGVIATRNDGAHIALFFVEGSHHRQGIGKQLFQRVKDQCRHDKMTVNSSPYAVGVYHRLGFVDTDREQVEKGVKFTPMELILP